MKRRASEGGPGEQPSTKGLGLFLTRCRHTGRLVVTSLLQGGAAERSGLIQVGDIVAAVRPIYPARLMCHDLSHAVPMAHGVMLCCREATIFCLIFLQPCLSLLFALVSAFWQALNFLRTGTRAQVCGTSVQNMLPSEAVQLILDKQRERLAGYIPVLHAHA
jgi:hypothetical protein